MPALHNRVIKVYEEAKKKNRGVFNKHRRSGPFPVYLHKAQLDLMYLQMV